MSFVSIMTHRDEGGKKTSVVSWWGERGRRGRKEEKDHCLLRIEISNEFNELNQ